MNAFRLSVLAAALVAAGAAAQAEEVRLSDAQLDGVTAGIFSNSEFDFDFEGFPTGGLVGELPTGGLGGLELPHGVPGNEELLFKLKGLFFNLPIGLPSSNNAPP